MDQLFDRETATAPSQPYLVPVDVAVHEPTTKPTDIYPKPNYFADPTN